MPACTASAACLPGHMQSCLPPAPSRSCAAPTQSGRRQGPGATRLEHKAVLDRALLATHAARHFLALPHLARVLHGGSGGAGRAMRTTGGSCSWESCAELAATHCSALLHTARKHSSVIPPSQRQLGAASHALHILHTPLPRAPGWRPWSRAPCAPASCRARRGRRGSPTSSSRPGTPCRW